MTMTRRPRVAAIGLSDTQVASIEPLCGVLRPVASLDEYLDSYSWTETDVMVSDTISAREVEISANLLIIGPSEIYWSDSYQLLLDVQIPHNARTNTSNKERELVVSPTCPGLYKPLAGELSRQVRRSGKPPGAIETSRQVETPLIETTSGHPVALRLVLPAKSSAADGETSGPIALLIPEVSNLSAWFRAFLYDIHKIDPARVPQPPPRLSQPSDWYTPEEKDLSDRVLQIESEIERLAEEHDRLREELAEEGEKADQGPRRALWADGDDLTDAVSNLLTDLGFEVRDMDSELKQGEPKLEDLRLTLQGTSGWEAIVEVKGYTRGTRTNDARQIREHRDHYFGEKGRPPNIAVWLSNPHRTIDPSSRLAPDQNVKEAAENVGAVHVLVTDLY